MNAIRRKWREGKVRPIPGNPPHDRPISRGNFFTFWRICDDPFPATPHPPQATLARPVCVFQAWRNLPRKSRDQTASEEGSSVTFWPSFSNFRTRYRFKPSQFVRSK